MVKKNKLNGEIDDFMSRILIISEEARLKRQFIIGLGLEATNKCVDVIRELSDKELIEYSEIDWRILLFRPLEFRNEDIKAIISLYRDL